MAHASGGLERPIVAPAGHIVVATFAGLRLVGGAVRPSQDARLLLPQVLALSKHGLDALSILFSGFFLFPLADLLPPPSDPTTNGAEDAQ